ncbi:MAG: hypothetical protein IRZ26_02060 [Clostridia bacterium]|nr:hypothetical protein [Clostridia bacterium]
MPLVLVPLFLAALLSRIGLGRRSRSAQTLIDGLVGAAVVMAGVLAFFAPNGWILILAALALWELRRAPAGQA